MSHLPRDLADVVRRAYVVPVDDATAERHVALAAAAAREHDTPSSSRRAPSRRPLARLWRPAFAAGLAALALPAGLAVAGVDLPEPVSAPYEAVGVELPNQAEPPRRQRVEQPPAATPAVPDGGVREGHAADDARGERRSEERNKGRRGDEASEGRRQGGDNGTRRSEERSKGRRGEQQRSENARPQAPKQTPPAQGRERGERRSERRPETPRNETGRPEPEAPAKPEAPKGQGTSRKPAAPPAAAAPESKADPRPDRGNGPPDRGDR